MMLKHQKTLRGWEKLATFLRQKTLKRVNKLPVKSEKCLLEEFKGSQF